MPVDPHSITEVAQRLSTRLEATYRDIPNAEVEGVLVVATVKRGGSGKNHVIHFNTSDMPAYAARGLLAEVDDRLGGNLPGGRD